jgi:uncharacterized Zn-finger protein
MIKQNIIFTNKKEVVCDGSNNFETIIDSKKSTLGHPKIYLKMADNQNEITCPYCSKTWILKESI